MGQIRHRDRFARAAVAKALGELAAEQAVNALILIWRNDPITNVRNAAEQALRMVYQQTQNPKAQRALRHAGLNF